MRSCGREIERERERETQREREKMSRCEDDIRRCENKKDEDEKIICADVKM